MNLSKTETAILNRLGYEQVVDILTHYPFRYEQLTATAPIDWQKDEKVIFAGPIVKAPYTYRKGKLSITRFELLYMNQVIKVVIFNRPWLSKLKLHDTITVIGKYQGNFNVSAINYNTLPLQQQTGIVPVYHLKENVDTKKFQQLLRKVYDYYQDQLDDIVPKQLQQRYHLLSHQEAIFKVHFPETTEDVKQATRTLKYEEFLFFQLQVLMRRHHFTTTQQKPKRQFNIDDVYRLANRMGYTLTSGQLTAIGEILTDIQSPTPMSRLLQGDVGSGKTLVAALAIAAMTLASKQSALMVPTEILAVQQFQVLKQLLKPLKASIACLYSGLPPYKKESILQGLKDGSIDIVVGTHALFQENVVYHDLGLVVTDEQHRFGVQQRANLLTKGNHVDFLLMSATPIPRTLASVIFGDLAVSTIDTLPVGRQPIKTQLILENSMQTILDQILQRMAEDNRCYVICPAIDESDITGLRHVTGVYEGLVKEINQKRNLQFKIGLLHGKLTSEEKERVMTDFANGKTQMLVSTTVIEVGVNVVEANQMVIYNANRFGLSQLHQLRGRIGRGQKQAYCYLLTSNLEADVIQRLNVIVQHTDGFKISEYDLKLRGPGDVLGVRQSGLPNLILGDFVKDFNIVKTAKEDALWILKQPQLFASLLAKVENKIKESNLIE